MRNWTPEARKAQSEAIRRWQPWKNSTGPKTQDGKNLCRLNAQRHGRYNANINARRREMSKILAHQRRFLQSVKQVMKLQKYLKTPERTIMMNNLAAEGHAVLDAFDRWNERYNRQNIVIFPLP